MRRASLASLLTLSAFLSALPMSAQETKALRRPFEPVNSGGAPVVSTHETIEFTGVSQLGNTTHLIFQDKTAKKNRWVGVGETVEGIHVLRYDARVEQAVVKLNGAEKVLQLRKGTGPVNTASAITPPPPAAGFNVPPPPQPVAAQILPSPAPAVATDPAAQPSMTTAAPRPAPAPNTPEGQVKAETEARMLVSDLLEIGMAQRKAYEEQQRRAAEGKSGQPAPPAEQPR